MDTFKAERWPRKMAQIRTWSGVDDPSLSDELESSESLVETAEQVIDVISIGDLAECQQTKTDDDPWFGRGGKLRLQVTDEMLRIRDSMVAASRWSGFKASPSCLKKEEEVHLFDSDNFPQSIEYSFGSRWGEGELEDGEKMAGSRGRKRKSEAISNTTGSEADDEDVKVPRRQVGVAKIRVELLSLGRPDCFSESEEDKPVDVDDGQHRDNSSNNSGSDENQSNTCTGGSGGPPGDDVKDPSKSDGKRNDRPGDNTDDPPENIKAVARFACPYQAYEPFLDCLQRGPKNPKGGCDGIYRLKQHLSRRHMLSFRCQTCWRSFDTKAKQLEHIRSPSSSGCRQKPRPEMERFMDIRHAADVDAMCSSSIPTEEDMWWRLFRLLVSGMDARDDFWLRGNYYPFYIAGDLSLTIPSLNFTDMSFSQLGIQTNHGGSHIGVSSAPGGLEQPPDYLLTGFGTPLATVADQPSHMLSQTLSIPVFESTPQSSHGPSQNWGGMSSTSNTNDPYESFDMDVVMSNDQPLQATSQFPPSNLNMSGASKPTPQNSSQATTHSSFSTFDFSTPSDSAPSNGHITPNITTAQLRLNNARLKARYQRAESVNVELRDANRAARSDITRADAILEEILTASSSEQAADGNTGDDMFRSLLQVSKLLEMASERLRKAS